jgi:hypothetical protein
MDYLAASITVAAFIFIVVGVYLSTAYPLLRLRPMLDGGSGKLTGWMGTLEGYYQGRAIKFKLPRERRGSQKFLMSLEFRGHNVIVPERKSDLASAKVTFLKASDLVPSLTRVQGDLFRVTSPDDLRLVGWVHQPEVRKVVSSLVSLHGVNQLQISDGAFWLVCYQNWLTSTRKNVEGILADLTTLEQSLVQSLESPDNLS